jgi:hypothetical protein
MNNLEAIIRTEAQKISELHNKVHETFKNRNKNIEDWKMACKNLHSYRSELKPIIEHIYNEYYLKDKELIDFSVLFLEINPFYFRSKNRTEKSINSLSFK